MIVADTSALVAVLLNEPEAQTYFFQMDQEQTKVSAGSLIEAGIVAYRKLGHQRQSALSKLIQRVDAEVLPVDAKQVAIAQEGFARFGKGRGEEPAVLNFGDCFAYALAKSLDAPLLFKGEDFAKTDVKRALP